MLGGFFFGASLFSAESGNLLLNPSFENGRDPWISLAAPDKPYWHDFAVAADPKNPGKKCAQLMLSGEKPNAPSEVWGVVQDVEGARELPAILRGRYYVENWVRGTEKQYIQAVLNIWTKEISGDLGARAPRGIPVQIAFVLCGIDQIPFEIKNRKFVFAGPKEPRIGEWVEFEFDLRNECKKQWGFLPKEMSGFRILLEARFDGRKKDEEGSRVAAYFDDLYVGEGKKPSSESTAEVRPPDRS